MLLATACSTAATRPEVPYCSNAMHSGKLLQTLGAAPNEDIIPRSRQVAAHQSMEAAAAWQGFLAHRM